MEALQKEFEGTEIEIRLDDNQPWFRAHSITNQLGIENTTDAVAQLDDDEVQRFETEITAGVAPRVAEAPFVNEPGAYRLVFRSDKEEAQRMKRWLSHEVLPELARTGSYSMNGEKDLGRFRIQGSNTKIRHFITENHFFTHVQDAADAAGIERARLPSPVNENHVHDTEVLASELGMPVFDGTALGARWVDYSGLQYWMWRSKLPQARTFIREYYDTLNREIARRRGTVAQSTPAPSPDSQQVQEVHLNGQLDEVHEALDNIQQQVSSQHTPAYYDWTAEDMREEVKWLIKTHREERDAISYERLYHRMRRKHGINVYRRIEEDGASSLMQTIDEDEMHLLLYEADRMFA